MRRLVKYLYAASFGMSISMSPTTQASTVAIIDSGVDYQHPYLLGRMWDNPVDFSFDGIDDDGNGYVDDVYGWNFFGRNSQIIDYKYNDLYNEQVLRFFDVQGRLVLGEATDADREWIQEVAQDKDFMKQIMTFGNYVHGTHVAGIASKIDSQAKIMGIRLIPVENPLLGLSLEVKEALREGKELNWIVEQVIKGGLYLFAKTQAMVFEEVSSYINSQNIRVANASLGTGASQFQTLLKPLLRLANGGTDVSVELLNEMTIFFLNRLNIEQAVMMRKAPNTLFVFAAGNEGTNNDIFPAAPASIDHPHVISVAAVDNSGELAVFSNFGMKVDVAAPGVAIVSSSPGNQEISLSGTSQAAPFIAGLAAEISAINEDLDPTDIKKIILDSVDYRENLKTKVLAGGVANVKRSLEAAALSLELPLKDAISQAREKIADQSFTRSKGSKASIYIPWRAASFY